VGKRKEKKKKEKNLLSWRSGLHMRWQEQGISFASSVNPLTLYEWPHPNLPLEIFIRHKTKQWPKNSHGLKITQKPNGLSATSSRVQQPGLTILRTQYFNICHN
jgi:hypothetical protein